MTELIQTTGTEVLVNLALGVITLLGAVAMFGIQKLLGKVKEQTAQIKDEASRKLLTDALEDVETLAIVTVGSIEQTTAAALREAVKDGKTDREELLKLGKQAFDEVKAAITPQAQQAITDNLGSFDVYLAKVIENAVLQLKHSAPPIIYSVSE